MSKIFYFIGYVFIIALLLMVGPWIFIWAINTLISASMIGAPTGYFIPQITFNFWSWLAAFCINGAVLSPMIKYSVSKLSE